MNPLSSIVHSATLAEDEIGQCLMIGRSLCRGLRGYNRRIDNLISKGRTVVCGVPQGSVLGPQFFQIYIIDIVILPLYSDKLQYADDTVLYQSYPDVNISLLQLQHDLYHIWITGYLIYVNDVNFVILHSKVVMFADDSYLFLTLVPQGLLNL